MAILWKKISKDAVYEVRTAGESCRLYKNGVLHSQFNPNQPVSGQVWDLLLLSAFFHEPPNPPRILLLGLGGGTVIRQLQHFLRIESITAVELDPIHIRIATRFFKIRGKTVDLICADARQWLRQYQGPPFDLIIDDLFGEESGEPVRAIAADSQWARLLLKHLSSKGTIAMNFVSPAAAKQSAFVENPTIQRRIANAFVLTNPKNENGVGVFLRSPGSVVQLRHRLNRFPQLDSRKKGCRLRFKAANMLPRPKKS